MDKLCKDCKYCYINSGFAHCWLLNEQTDYYETCTAWKERIPDGATMVRKIYNMCQARIDAEHSDVKTYKDVQDYIKNIIAEPYGINLDTTQSAKDIFKNDGEPIKIRPGKLVKNWYKED